MRRLELTGVATTVAELRSVAPARSDVRAAVEEIVGEVRRDGDEALRRLTERLDGVALPPHLAVPLEDMRAALRELDPELRSALELAAANIRAYHEREAPVSWRETLAQGQTVGQQIVPLAVAGLYVPGGLADYPSTVLMTATPAQVAGGTALADYGAGTNHVLPTGGSARFAQGLSVVHFQRRVGSRGRRGFGVSSGASRGRDRRGGGAAFSRALGAASARGRPRRRDWRRGEYRGDVKEGR